jgi:hypothetical protein
MFARSQRQRRGSRVELAGINRVGDDMDPVGRNAAPEEAVMDEISRHPKLVDILRE